MEGRKVRCRTCGGVFYETTEKYDSNKPLTGDMLRLCHPFCTFQWPVYDGSLAVESTSRFLMFCTQCAGLVSTTGELHFVDEEGDEVKKGSGYSMDNVILEKEPVQSEPLMLTQEHGVEQFVCKRCGKVCKSKAGLLAHQRIASSRKDAKGLNNEDDKRM